MRRLAILVAVVVVFAGAFTAWQFKKNIDAAKQQARVNALQQALSDMRGAIAKYHADNGRYPHSLEELVPKYLRAIPTDPMTGNASWRTTTEETVQPSEDFTAAAPAKSESVIVDVHSNAAGYGDY
jgi:general secretion pathway protein G